MVLGARVTCVEHLVFRDSQSVAGDSVLCNTAEALRPCFAARVTMKLCAAKHGGVVSRPLCHTAAITCTTTLRVMRLGGHWDTPGVRRTSF